MSKLIVPSTFQQIKNKFLNKKVKYIYSNLIGTVKDVRQVEHKVLVYCDNGLIVSHELVEIV